MPDDDLPTLHDYEKAGDPRIEPDAAGRLLDDRGHVNVPDPDGGDDSQFITESSNGWIIRGWSNPDKDVYDPDTDRFVHFTDAGHALHHLLGDPLQVLESSNGETTTVVIPEPEQDDPDHPWLGNFVIGPEGWTNDIGYIMFGHYERADGWVRSHNPDLAEAVEEILAYEFRGATFDTIEDSRL